MSGKVVGWAFDRPEDLSPQERYVLVALADNADSQGKCWPSRKAIIDKTGLSRSTVYRSLDALAAAGLFEEGTDEKGRECFWLRASHPETGSSHSGTQPPKSSHPGTQASHPGTEMSHGGTPYREPPEPSIEPEDKNVDVDAVGAPLCRLLCELIVANGSKEPTISIAWRDAERLMLERDGRDFDQAEALLRWAQGHEFWRSNVLSMHKFRAQYDQLRLQAEREGGLRAVPRSKSNAIPAGATVSAPSDRAERAWLAVKAALAEQLDESTLRIWLDELTLRGETENWLVIDGPPDKVGWVKRRYLNLMNRAAATDGIVGVRLYDRPEEVSDAA